VRGFLCGETKNYSRKRLSGRLASSRGTPDVKVFHALVFLGYIKENPHLFDPVGTPPGYQTAGSHSLQKTDNDIDIKMVIELINTICY